MKAALAAALALAALTAGAGCGDDVSDTERDRAIAEAQQAYEQALRKGTNLDDGPCIAEKLPDLSDWVVDVVHDPRTDEDDDPANQCSRYRDGDASHFVELAPDGAVIRAE